MQTDRQTVEIDCSAVVVHRSARQSWHQHIRSWWNSNQHINTFAVLQILRFLSECWTKKSKKSKKWSFFITFAMSVRHPPAPPPLMALLATHFFYPTLFLLQLNPTYMKRILYLVPLRNIVLSLFINWFKYWHSLASPAADCQLLVYSAIFMVTTTTICIYYKAQTMWKTHFYSQGMIVNGFKKIIFQNILMARKTPSESQKAKTFRIARFLSQKLSG